MILLVLVALLILIIYAVLGLARFVADLSAPKVVQLADLWAAEDDDDDAR